MAARLLLALAVFGAALGLLGVSGGPGAAAATRGLYAALVAAFLTTVAFGALHRQLARVGSFAAVQIPVDVGIVTALVYFSGGDQSVFAFLYVLVVVFGGMLAERRGAFGAAALSAAAHGAVLLAVREGLVPDYGGSVSTAGALLLATWSVHAGALFVVALLASHLSRELSRVDEQLGASESRLHLLRSLHERTVESLMSGLLTTDVQGRITSFNREAERITGVAVSEALGRDIEDALPGARARVVDPVAEGLARPKLRERMAYRSRAGGELHLGLSGSMLLDEKGCPIGTVVIFQDVTRVVEMEAELRRSERLAATGRLAADIAHEVRNPLAAISGSVQMLLDEAGARGPEERYRLTDIVMRETDRLNTLITDFLHYAHPPAPRPEPVDLARTVAEVAEMFAATGRPDVKLEQQVAPTLRVFADPAQLRQLLWNLCTNAVQAMPDGGRLTLEARRLDEPPQEHSIAGRNDSVKEGSAWVDIRVGDTGVGILPETLERIFDPFFTTKPEGTGLGLATVHRIVEGNAGSVRVESAPGEGTTFSILLPEAVEEL
jgi:two-component system sensor histidine kinase PilS (NtrC family)